jgi:hypothetical protein
VRRLFVALAFVLTACGDLQAGSQALAPASPSPAPSSSPAPLPSGVVDPKPLIQEATRLNGGVLRVDDVAAKLVSSADYMGTSTVAGPSVNVPATVWVIAIVGDIRQTWGVLPLPNSQCKLSAYGAATGEIWSTREGPVAICQPYFARSLTPPDAPLRCAANTYGNGVSATSSFSETHAGRFGFTAVRDDAWRQPTRVSGTFLARATEGTVPYEDAFCLKAFVRQGPAVEGFLASGVGAVVMPNALPPLEWAIWLRGYHAVSGWADAAGHIEVVVEPKAGYEWAFFDWHSLVPGGGYVMFGFNDASGREILPWRLANGP